MSPSQKHLIFAWFCSSAAFVVGLPLFLWWLFKPLHGQELAGSFLTELGLVLSPFGAWSLYRYCKLEELDVRQSPTKWIALLLIANYPIAAMFGIHAVNNATSTRIAILNRSPDLVENLKLVGTGLEKELPDIKPGAEKVIQFAAGGDGALELSGTVQGQPFHQTLSDYTTTTSGGTFTIIVRNSDTIEVKEDYGTHF